MEFNFSETMEENKTIFTTPSDTLVTATKEGYVSERPGGTGVEHSLFSPLAPSFHSRDTSAMMGLLHQEPKPGDIAPTALHLDNEMLLNFRNSGSDSIFGDVDHVHNSYFMGGGARAESISSNLWGEASGSGSSGSPSRGDDMADSFDFLAKSLSSANNYVSTLTREQLSVLRSFRPSLLYEFLQEVAKVRSEKRLRRAGPNECAFCKNNGENEECYSNHALKDWRGYVTCPVLRAFRCPRCGATGDRAHTIKYCPEYNENSGLERPGNFTRRRLGSSSTSLLFGPQRQAAGPSTPTPGPTSFAGSSLWNFN